MQSTHPALAALALALATSATAADGAREIAVPGAHGVDVAIAMDLRVVDGPAESLRLEGDEEVLGRTEVRVEQGLVRVLSRAGVTGDRRGKLRGVLTLPRVDAVALAGSGRIDVERLRGESVRATLSGSGDLHVERVESTDATLHLSGSGDLDVADGRAGRLSATVSGVGSVRADRLPAADATVRISGAGSATVWASETLDARVSGVGKVSYYGDPRLERRTSGVGSVTRLGAAPG